MGYEVIDPQSDARRDYHSICDVSGDSRILDTLFARVAPRGEVVLAGFYSAPLGFDFAPAFMREASMKIAAQWQQADLDQVMAHLESGALSLDGLITHRCAASDAAGAYRTAFSEADCLKMILDWRTAA
jgi:3-hydroxyethyl bacteriochlorophyllide a dehydrogenase